MLNGCSNNGHRWVYVAALTDVAFNLYINDGRNPTWRYHNRQGETGEVKADLHGLPLHPVSAS